MKVVAIKVHQPLGEFFIAKIRANELLNISYSEEYVPTVPTQGE